ncbi:glutamine dumper 2-like protein [Tanacetum coccineum]
MISPSSPLFTTILQALFLLVALSGSFLVTSMTRHDIESGNVSQHNVTSPHKITNNEHELCEKEEKLFVIMAGEEKPTFLATPSSSRTTSFGSSSWRSNLSALTEASLSSVGGKMKP